MTKVMQKFFFFLLLLTLSLFGHTQELEGESIFMISADGTEQRPEDLLSLYIQHKSPSGYEKEAGDWLKAVCIENGLHINEFGNEDGKYNFAASLYPLSPALPNIILLNHIDVVPEGDITLWKFPPYSGKIAEGKVWGRGAFDNKGAAMMQLFGLLEFKSRYSVEDPPYNITFLSVSSEEIMGEGGARYVVKNYLELLNPAVVIGEGPTELSSLTGMGDGQLQFGISIAHKRPLWLELILDIQASCHGSVTPTQYANKEMVLALSRLIEKKPKVYFNKNNKDILRALGDLESGLKGLALRNPGLFKAFLVPKLREKPEIMALFTNTITLTSVSSDNNVINKITNQSRALIDCRLLPDYSQEKFLEYVKETISNDSIQINILKELKPLPISDTITVYFRQMRKAIRDYYPGASVLPIMLPSTNDVGHFRLNDIPGYSIIPVIVEECCIRGIHAENEYIPVSALYQGQKVYRKFLENMILR